MKKKLALLLVVTMALSMVPATAAFARSDNRIVSVKTVTDESDIAINRFTTIGFTMGDGVAVGGSGTIMLTISGAEWATADYSDLDSVSDTVYKDGDGNQVTVMEAEKVYTEYNLSETVAYPLDANKNPIIGGGQTSGPIPGATIKAQSSTKILVSGIGAITGKVVIPMNIVTTGSTEGVKVTVDSRDTNISAGSMTIGTVSAGDTVASADTIDIAPGETETLKEITIDETVAGGTDIDTLKFTAPAGFTFADIDETDVKAAISGGYTVQTYEAGIDDTDDSTYVIKFNGTVKSTTGTGRGIITVSGLQLIADTDAKIGDVNITVKGDATKQSLKVADCVDYDVTVALKDTAPTLVSGRFDADLSSFEDEEANETAEFTIKENASEAWSMGRATTFTVPEGVKIVGVDVTSVKNILTSTIGAGYVNTLTDGTETADGTATFKISEDGTVATLSGLKKSTADNVKAELGLKFYVSLSPDFEGDVAVTVGNSIEDQEVVVAKAVTPIKATFKTTNVGIAYKDVAVGDVTITENAEAALSKDGTGILALAIDELDPEIQFNTDGDVDYEITSGDIDINKVYAKGGVLFVDVKRESTTPSTIEIKGLKATLDRTPAEGEYSLLAYGDAIFANDDNDKDVDAWDGKFDDIDGIEFKDYINVTTAAPDKSGTTTNKVAVTIGSTTYRINGVDATLDTAPVVQNNRTLVPTRAISEGLGYQVLWNEATNTATIVAPDNRTAAFTLGSNVVTVNGVPGLTMDTAPVVADGRMLVPFRALGDALGINVTWDEATNTATFN